jgi:hypothetical protein
MFLLQRPQNVVDLIRTDHNKARAGRAVREGASALRAAPRTAAPRGGALTPAGPLLATPHPPAGARPVQAVRGGAGVGAMARAGEGGIQARRRAPTARRARARAPLPRALRRPCPARAARPAHERPAPPDAPHERGAEADAGLLHHPRGGVGVGWGRGCECVLAATTARPTPCPPPPRPRLSHARRPRPLSLSHPRPPKGRAALCHRGGGGVPCNAQLHGGQGARPPAGGAPADQGTGGGGGVGGCQQGAPL